MFAILILLVIASAGSSEILQDLVLNYSDFNYVNSIAIGFTYVYFGTTNGVTRYNINKDEWAEPLNGIPGLRGSQIYEIRVSQDDENIWVRTEFGIFKYADVLERWDQVESFPADVNPFGKHIAPDFDYFPPPNYNYLNDGVLADFSGHHYPLTDILSDDWGNLWIGTEGLGAIWANESSRRMEFREFGLIQPDIMSIYSDDGVLWMGGQDVGTYRTGLTIFDWRRNKFDFIETGSLPNPIYDDINCIIGNDDYIFFGTNFGVVMVDKKDSSIDRRFYQISGLPGREVKSLYCYGDSLFIGTNFGLALVDLSPDTTDNGATILLTPSEINAMLGFDDFLWIGTSNGTYRLDLLAGEMGRMNLSNIAAAGEIYDIERKGDMIWIATQDELVSINAKTAATQAYPETIRYGGARALAVGEDLVAAATRDGLLLLWTESQQKNRYELYTTNDGLISNDVRDVLIDGDYIWVGTDRGLTRFWLKSPSLF